MNHSCEARGNWLIVLALLWTGCSGKPAEVLPPVYPASGVVKMKGKPLEGAVVSFCSTKKGQRAGTGLTNAQGEFTITTYQEKPGATEGEMVVTISKVDAPPADPKTGAFPPSRELLPADLTNTLKSPLRATVKASDKPEDNRFEFNLE